MSASFSRPKTGGLLVPVFALRHAKDFGIGDTQAVCDAIGFCAAHGFEVLQILPIHETIGDHSPYNPITSRGLSPALLKLTSETVPGLTSEMLSRLAPEDWLARLRAEAVPHGTVHSLKMQVLLAAFRGFRKMRESARTEWREFEEFQHANASWLPAYTLYRLLDPRVS